MRNRFIEKAVQKGSLMVEAMAMLGLIAMVTPMVYKKAAERTTEMQDINEAGHLRIISRALDDFLKDNYSSINGSGMKQLAAADVDKLKAYFPQGFETSSKLYKDIKFYINIKGNGTTEPKVLTGFSVAEPNNDVPLLRASRIASMIGTNGGYSGLNSEADVHGVQGIWSIKKTDVGNPKEGSVVATSMQSIADAAGGEDLLYRVDKGTDYLNTMKTTLFMEGNNIEGTGQLIMASTELTGQMKSGSVETGALTAASADITDTLKAVTANITGALTAGSISTDGSLEVTGKGVTTLGTLGAGKTTVTNLISTDTIEAGGVTVDAKVLSYDPSINSKKALKVRGGIDADVITAEEINTKALGFVTLQGGVANLGDTNYTFKAKDTEVIIGKESGALKDINFTLTDKVTMDAPWFAMNKDGIDFGDRAMAANSTLKMSKEGDGVLVNLQKGTLKTPWFRTNDAEYGLEAGPVGSPQFKVMAAATTINTPEVNANQSESFNIKSPAFQVGNNTVADKLVINDANNITTQGVVHFSDASTEILQIKNDNAPTGTPSVYVRKGAIQVAGDGTNITAPSAKYSGKTGFVQVDKILSNTKNFNSVRPSSTLGNSDYDAYQVNPAYTSVMHDIKLSTRGNARLSDILPDFINKGIYVLDNTYKGYNGATRFDWTNSGHVNLNKTDLTTAVGNTWDCGSNAACETTPWLGFIPKPQCPPGYSRVATISPLRFNASQAYAVQHISDKMNLYPILNPADQRSDYLRFQGSTWMNMSLQANDSGASFKGWHALMGFIYSAQLYENFITAISGGTSWKTGCGGNLADCVVWNVMPVYNQELSAIANVYCYFDRSQFSTSEIDSTYDQLGQFRAVDYNKPNTTYNNRLNDAGLGYTDVW